MITFDKDGQCHRFASFANDYEVSGNLCPFVRQLIKGFALFVLLWTVVSMEIVGLILAAFIIWSFGIGALFSGVAGQGLMGVWPTLAFMILCLASAVLIAATVSVLKNMRYKKKKAEFIKAYGEAAWYTKSYEPSPRKDSVLREWLRAKHDKICPQIQFK